LSVVRRAPKMRLLGILLKYHHHDFLRLAHGSCNLKVELRDFDRQYPAPQLRCAIRLRYHDAPITAKDKMQSRKHTHTHTRKCVCVCVCDCVCWVASKSSCQLEKNSLGPQGDIFSHRIYNASADWQRRIPLFLSFLGGNLNSQKSLQTHSGNLKLGRFLWFFLGCRTLSFNQRTISE